MRLECVKAVDTFYEVLFDKHLPSGNDKYGIAEERVYRVSESSLLLIFAQGGRWFFLYIYVLTFDTLLIRFLIHPGS